MDRLAKILSSLKHLDLDGDIEQKESVQAGFGGTCDVYMAWSKKHNTKVAIKRIRVFLRKDEKFAKKLAKEIRIWASLDHECVLPFLGYFVEGMNAMPNLVSLWMVNGTLDDYMEEFPRGGEDTRYMLYWIACGLDYLHSRSVTHADLKSKNILVSEARKPLLADFGLSSALTFTKSGATTTMAGTGTVRWMAIELFDSEPPIHTPATDVWAFGMVAFELLSGDIPYGNKADPRIPSLILEGKLPDKPEDEHRSAFFHPLWDMCQVCWRRTPEERPSAEKLFDILGQMATADSDSKIPSEGDSESRTQQAHEDDVVIERTESLAVDSSMATLTLTPRAMTPVIEQELQAKEEPSMAPTLEPSPAENLTNAAPHLSIKDILDDLGRLGPCVSGYAWIHMPQEHGFRCEGGSHFKSYQDASTLLGIGEYKIHTLVNSGAASPSVSSDILIEYLSKSETCSGGYPWIDKPDEGGFICTGGSHFRTYAEARALAENTSPANVVPSAVETPSQTNTQEQLALLEKLDPCPSGYPWEECPDEGGFRCAGGSHFRSYQDVQNLANGPPSVEVDPALERAITGLVAMLKKAEPCPSGSAWVLKPESGGFLCEGGGHFKSYEEMGVSTEDKRVMAGLIDADVQAVAAVAKAIKAATAEEEAKAPPSKTKMMDLLRK